MIHMLSRREYASDGMTGLNSTELMGEIQLRAMLGTEGIIEKDEYRFMIAELVIALYYKLFNFYYIWSTIRTYLKTQLPYQIPPISNLLKIAIFLKQEQIQH
jgi:hypothetical protein